MNEVLRTLETYRELRKVDNMDRKHLIWRKPSKVLSCDRGSCNNDRKKANEQNVCSTHMVSLCEVCDHEALSALMVIFEHCVMVYPNIKLSWTTCMYYFIILSTYFTRRPKAIHYLWAPVQVPTSCKDGLFLYALSGHAALHSWVATVAIASHRTSLQPNPWIAMAITKTSDDWCSL